MFYKLVIFILFLYLFLKKNKEAFQNNLLNIYDEPLQICKQDNMSNGSWDNKGKCSELDGGVHQICIKNISNNTKDFSNQTGQSDWSNKRNNDNHCVCLGAWSLYNTKIKDNKNNILKCDAIPKNALSKKYISKFSQGWNKWNGLELDDQIVNGVEALMNNCYKNNQQSIKLKNNFCEFSKDIKSLNNSKLYKNLCN